MEESSNGLLVEFLLPPEAAGQATPRPRKLSCDCGARQFALVNELVPDITRGIPASRMYECLDCGRYRLG